MQRTLRPGNAAETSSLDRPRAPAVRSARQKPPAAAALTRSVKRHVHYTPATIPFGRAQDRRDSTGNRSLRRSLFETMSRPVLLLRRGPSIRCSATSYASGRCRAARRGARVKRGQQLARLRNSGQSDAPHLHVHIMDAPSPLGAEGLPLAFDTFDLDGHLSSLKVLVDGTGWRATERKTRRRGEMPVENAVLSFPERNSPHLR